MAPLPVAFLITRAEQLFGLPPYVVAGALNEVVGPLEPASAQTLIEGWLGHAIPGGSSPPPASALPEGALAVIVDGQLQWATQGVLATNASFRFVADHPQGTITHSLEFMLTGDFERPALVWLNKSGEMEAAFYWHSFDNPNSPNPWDGVTARKEHRAVEIKTWNGGATDPESPVGVLSNALYMATRLSIGSGLPRVPVIWNFIDKIEVNPGYYLINTQWGQRYRMPDVDGVTRTFAQELVQVDGNGSAFLDVDVFPGVDPANPGAGVNPNGNARFRVARNVTTTGTVWLTLYKATGGNDLAVELSSKGDVHATRDVIADRQVIAPKVVAPDTLASSPVRTGDGGQAVSNLPGSNGTVWAAKAECKVAGTYTQIRFCVGTTAPSGLTDLKAGVWNASTKALISGSVSGVAQATATNAVVTVALDTPVTLAVGDVVYLGVAALFSSAFSLRGWSGAAAINAINARAVSGTAAWTGGANALPALGSAGTGNLPWVELVP